MSDSYTEAIKELTKEAIREMLPEIRSLIIAEFSPKEPQISTGPIKDELISANDVEIKLHITAATRISWQERGIIPTPFKLGRRCYFKASEIDAFIENQRKLIK